MEELNGVTIYWLISLGLLVGFIIGLLMESRGMNMTGNLVFGVVGSVVIGIAAIVLNLYGALIYAALGTVSFLFLINVFSIRTEHKTEARVMKS